MYLALAQNIALLVSTVVIYSVILRQWRKDSPIYSVLTGILFGLAAIFGMMLAVKVSPGVIFDGRSVILGISGIFGGPLAALISAILAGTYRMHIGGSGAPVGIFNVFFTCAAGVAFRCLVNRKIIKRQPLSLLLFSFSVHSIVLASFFLIPGISANTIISELALPILITYPTATLLISAVISDSEKRIESEKKLRENQKTLARAQKIARIYSWELDHATKEVRFFTEDNADDPEVSGLEIMSLDQFIRLVHPADVDLLRAAYHRSCSDGTDSGEHEHRVVSIFSGIPKHAITRWAHERNRQGKLIKTSGMTQDISERKRQEEELQSIRWMLDPGKSINFSEAGDFNDESENISDGFAGLIKSCVDLSTLNEICSDHISLLETSAVIFEKDGKYAYCAYISEWCRHLNESCRNQCHDTCWVKAAGISIETGQPADIACSGGLRIYSVPVIANGQVVGASCAGYGDPPRDRHALEKIASVYGTDSDKLAGFAVKYRSRPPYIITLAKKRLHSSAKLIGSIIESRLASQTLYSSEAKYRSLFSTMTEMIVLHELVFDERNEPVDYRITDCNEAFTYITGIEREDAMGKLATELYQTAVAPFLRKYADVAIMGDSLFFETYYAPMDKYFFISVISPERNKFATISLDITKRKRAEEAGKKMLTELGALNRVSSILRTSQSLEEMLPLLLSETLDVIGSGTGSVSLFPSDNGKPGLTLSQGRLTGKVRTASWFEPDNLSGYILEDTLCLTYIPCDDPFMPPALKPELSDILNTAYLPIRYGASVVGIMAICAEKPDHFTSEELNLLISLSQMASTAIHRLSLHEKTAALLTSLRRSSMSLSLAYDATLEGWSRALDLRDHETEGHSARVTDRTIELAALFGISDEELVHIRRGALLHDIGKMGIPDSILLKPGQLTDPEWKLMKTHPQLAYELLSPIEYLQPAIDIPYCHHEKYDGTGYPRGLKGEEIPLSARIFAIIDVYDALTSDRPYRKAWSKTEALAYISEQCGRHFDPAVIRVFLKATGGYALAGQKVTNSIDTTD